MTGGFVYILTNRKNGALYTGLCADIAARMMQHRDGTGSKFCKKYGINQLVYVESHDAITREKAIKKWNRAWKIALIERNNPDWRDLFFDINC